MEGNGGENESVELNKGEETVVVVQEDEELEKLKKRISGHPLYGLLIHSHLNCLKVSLGDIIGEVGITTTLDHADHNYKLNATNPTTSDLDKFMEVYCMALSKLKEAMEKPLQESENFIDAMYVQLSECSVTPEPTSPFE